MRRLAGILSVATLALLPGCSEDTITATPGDATTTADQSEQPAGATIGDTISLHGALEPDLELAVTVLSVVDPAKGDKFFKAEEGSRYVAVETRLENTGPIDYSDSPTNGAVLIDASSHQYDTWGASGIEPNLDGSVRILPGDERVGFIVFQVTKGETPDAFQFTLDSGTAYETGQWSL
jgi:Domain of unknown function (DUF4352)